MPESISIRMKKCTYTQTYIARTRCKLFLGDLVSRITSRFTAFTSHAIGNGKWRLPLPLPPSLVRSDDKMSMKIKSYARCSFGAHRRFVSTQAERQNGAEHE